MRRQHRDRPLIPAALLVLLAASAAFAATPAVVVDEPASDWDLAGGILVWTLDCDQDVAGYLKRRPLFNAGVQSLAETPRGCGRASWFRHLAADDSGIYSYQPAMRLIQRRPHDRPDVVDLVSQLRPGQEPSPGTSLVLEGGDVYWGTGSAILRAPKAGGEVVRVAAAGRVAGVAADGDHVYWLDGQGLWRLPRSCPGSGSCTPRRMIGETARNIWLSGDHVYWISPHAGRSRIRRLDLAARRLQTLYTATDESWRISQPVVWEEMLFWKEHRVGTHLPTARVRRLALDRPGARPQDLAVDLPGTGLKMGVLPLGLYFSGDGRRIVRLPFDAEPVVRELSAADLEVTQGIQSLSGDVPLGRHKPTAVRFYGGLRGVDAAGVEAELRGTVGGQPLPGSPLAPLSGPQTLRQGAPLDRSQRPGSWRFELPAEWTAQAEIILEAVVDPRGFLGDSNRRDNVLRRTVRFIERSPACVRFIPIRAHGPRASTDDANFHQMIDLSRRLLPSRDIWPYQDRSDLAELEVCWWKGVIPYPCYGPYEVMGDPAKIIAGLLLRYATSDDPDECDAANAVTHYVGMVHASIPAGINGKGAFCIPAAWIHMPDPGTRPGTTDPAADTPDWNWPPRGVTLAHELGHNYGRWHVDCGSPESPDDDYPFPDCQIDDTPGSTLDRGLHFGFDLETQTPIPPQAVGDLMSYSGKVGKPRWPSSYTWEGIGNVQSSRFSVARCGAEVGLDLGEDLLDWLVSVVVFDDQDGTSPAVARLDGAREAMLVHGLVDAGAEKVEIASATRRRVKDLTPGQMKKWQRLAARELKAGKAGGTGLRLQLVGTDGALLDRFGVPLLPIPREGGEAETVRPFVVTVPVPDAALARIEIAGGGSVLAALTAGSAAPEVEILAPRPGERLGERLTVRWSGRDADRDPLLYTVQYSADGGRRWRSLAVDLPGRPDTAISELAVDGVEGSRGARVRVVASDGLHAAEVVSGIFEVADRPPKPTISSPAAGQSVLAGEAVLLRGGGHDPETGPVGDKCLSWRLDGREVGGGATHWISGLAPGSYQVELTACDPGGRRASVERTLEVKPLLVPIGGAPSLDGRCTDASWDRAATVELAAYRTGGQASASLLRHSADLWLCLSNLVRTPRIAGRPSRSHVGVRVDVDGSRNPVAASDDLGFFVREDGIPFTRAGDGAGGFAAVGPSGVEARVHRDGKRWSAELRLAGVYGKASGGTLNLVVGHYAAEAGSRAIYQWPHGADPVGPDTWARTVSPSASRFLPFGGKKPRFSVLATEPPGPRVVRVEPTALAADSPPRTVAVHGTGFDRETRVLWNGEPRRTVFVSATELRFALRAPDLEFARRVGIAAHQPGKPVAEPVELEIRRRAGAD